MVIWRLSLDQFGEKGRTRDTRNAKREKVRREKKTPLLAMTSRSDCISLILLLLKASLGL